MKQIPSLVSIGMPIYNAEKYLQKALDSLLAQDYTNFELIISDNASTDRTSEICGQYAARDKRIHYFNNKENMGAFYNFKRVLELSTGEYFMWAAHDDEWEAQFLGSCVKGLKDKPEAGLAFSNMVSIDSFGRIIRKIPSFKSFANQDRAASIASYILAPEFLGKANLFYSVYRFSVMKEYLEYTLSSPEFSNPGSDMAVVLGALCRSNMVIIESVLFKKRLDRDTDSPEKVDEIFAILPYTNTLPEGEMNEYLNAMKVFSKNTPYTGLVESLLEYRSNLNRDLLEKQKSVTGKTKWFSKIDPSSSLLRKNKIARKVLDKFNKVNNYFLQTLRNQMQKRKQEKIKEMAERKAIQFYSQFISDNSLCFDVGANVGNRTKLFLALGASVVAVEPQDHCAEFLISQFGGHTKFSLVRKALGSAEGTAELLISNADTISSLSKEWINSVKKSGRFKEYTWEQKQIVPVTTLDMLIGQHGVPDFVKIDVEGFEYEVIKGLTQPVKAMSFEFTPEYFDAVVLCLDHLKSIGEIQLNYSIGESMEFALEHWVSSSELTAMLLTYKDSNTVFGDVYVRFVDFNK